MKTSLLKPTLSLAAILIASGTVSQAITIVSDNLNQNVENVLFNDPLLISVGTSIQGKGNSSGLLVNISADVSITGNGGQADVFGTGSTSQNTVTFDDVVFSLDGGGTFTRLILNPNPDQNGSVVFTVNYIDPIGVLNSISFPVDDNGQNYHTIDAEGNEKIISVMISGVGNLRFEEIKQIRIGGATGGGPPNNVPDGGMTAVLLGLGLFGLTAARKIQM